MPLLTHYELHLNDPDLRTVQTSMAILIIPLFDGLEMAAAKEHAVVATMQLTTDIICAVHGNHKS